MPWDAGVISVALVESSSEVQSDSFSGLSGGSILIPPPERSFQSPSGCRGVSIALCGSVNTAILFAEPRMLVVVSRYDPLSGLSARDAEPLHLGNQRRALQPESGGCAFRASDDPIGFSQRLDDVLALGVL
jgi:hypothetical protein